MSPRRLVLLAGALLLAPGCVREDGTTPGYQVALQRIERGVYTEVELRPQWMWLRADGIEHRSFWPGGQMRPDHKSAVSQAVMRARAKGHAVAWGDQP